MHDAYYIYILTNTERGVLYIGITNHLARRIEKHKNAVIEGFTKKYRLHRLVYAETYSTAYDAIQREKQLKHWNRTWKIELIESMNPRWEDLSGQI
ncbi:MAG: GIY-YIG nuclease family protein [Candidatus Liptonbacteria bacterium]|nr:GIY-YIG nuclease family protein [Candidatus Liptonbacteria bacterium]